MTSGGLLNPSPAPQSKMFELLDFIADVQTKPEGETMGEARDAEVKRSTAAGAKLAAQHEATAASENRKSQNYSKWLNDQGNATQSKISKTTIKK